MADMVESRVIMDVVKLWLTPDVVESWWTMWGLEKRRVVINDSGVADQACDLLELAGRYKLVLLEWKKLPEWVKQMVVDYAQRKWSHA